MARRLVRELDEALGRLRGDPPAKDLVSIICHDLKDPLASIVMGTGFLKKTNAVEEPSVRRVVDAISRSADRMTQVVSDFHDLAKLDTGLLPFDARPTDVVGVIQAALAPFEAQAREKQVALGLESGQARPMALCDRGRLGQIVTKLVGNALRFTPAEGSVTVAVAPQDGRLRIAVRDTGRGIAADRIPAIFDHAANARRTPRDGPGMGLPIARGLVELHGGELTVESVLGEGSTFAFSLPAA